MSVDPMMMGSAMGGGSDVDLMAMQEAMSGGGMGMETTMVEVPVWAVSAVEELISVLETEIANGNVTPDMLMDVGGDASAMPAPTGAEVPPLPM